MIRLSYGRSTRPCNEDRLAPGVADPPQPDVPSKVRGLRTGARSRCCRRIDPRTSSDWHRFVGRPVPRCSRCAMRDWWMFTTMAWRVCRGSPLPATPVVATLRWSWSPSSENRRFPMSHASSDPLLGAEVVRAASLGAVIGVMVVLAMSVVTILLAGRSFDLLGVAALAASFGGAGFGAMMGGVVAAVRVHADDEPGRSRP